MDVKELLQFNNFPKHFWIKTKRCLEVLQNIARYTYLHKLSRGRTHEAVKIAFSVKSGDVV